MPKVVTSSKEGLAKLLKGLDTAADIVTATLGPKGRNVYFETPLGYEFSNDGVTVAAQCVFEDKQEDAGAYIIRNITGQANDDAGDGTTTTALLTQSIIHEALNRPENPMVVRASLNSASQKLLKDLAKSAIPIKKDDVIKVAKISAEDSKIAELITEIISKLGEKAVINVEDSKTFNTDYEIVDGFEVPVGFMSPYFINDKKVGKAIYKDVPLIATEKKIANMGDISVFQEVLKENGITSAVIVCDDIDDSMLGVYVNSKQLNTFSALVIRATGETLKDIAGVTGATLISDSTGVGFKDVQLGHMGQVKRVVCDANKTIFFTDSKIAKTYADMVEYSTASENNMYIQEKNKHRLAKLRGGIATLRIAAPTDTERIYLRRKAEDAVKATQAALEEGIVEGGGVALWRIAQKLKPNSIGNSILKNALKAPFRKIVENGGLDYSEIVTNLPEGKGFDAKNEKYVDMIESGIIDPAKVERLALENSISTAGMFITTHALIVEKNEDQTRRN